MPRKRKMRGTARSALKRNPSGFSCNFSGAGTGKARLDGKRSLKPDGKGKSGRQMNQLPASGKTAPEQACLFAVGRCPVERHPWTREGKFYGSPSFFLFPPPSCDALQMTPSLLPPGPGAHPMGCCIPPEIDYTPERTCLPACPNTSRWTTCAPCYPGAWRRLPSRRRPERS